MDSKTRGIVAYITFIGWIVAIATNNPKDEQASFHIRQMLGLVILAIAANLIMIIPILGWIAGPIISIFALVCWIIGLISAVQGERKEVPIVGAKFQDWFKGL